MKLHTACFFTYQGAGAISIARRSPAGRSLPSYAPLAPGAWFKSVDYTEYRRRYFEQLSRLDARRVIEDLAALADGHDPVLLCWERLDSPNSWCHRRMVAEWLRAELGLEVREVPETLHDLSPPRMEADAAQLSLFGDGPACAGIARPTVALSIRQPWAWAILYAGKDIENRTWASRFRGQMLIHASAGMTRQEYDSFPNELLPAGVSLPAFPDLPRGGIVGQVEMIDCVQLSPSRWFFGPKGFVLKGATPLPFEPMKGALGFFQVGRKLDQQA